MVPAPSNTGEPDNPDAVKKRARESDSPTHRAYTLTAEVRDGSVRDAILHSCGANATHGLRRTNADKRRAVKTLLKDAEWVRLSDAEIARLCAVSQPFVGKLRDELGLSYNPYKIVERGGKRYQQDTTNIGKRPTSTDEPSPNAALWDAPAGTPISHHSDPGRRGCPAVRVYAAPARRDGGMALSGCPRG